MSQQTSGHAPATAGPGTGAPTTQVARDEAAEVGRTATEAGRHVAGTAREQAGQVTQEARRQARDLLGEARTQAADQARTGQQKATEGLRALATELHQMADGGEQHGPASDLAKQAASRVDDAAEWLSRREPGDLLDEVRGLARRRPGAFLIGAALAGVLAGRLTRGAVDANRDTSGQHAMGARPPAPLPAHTPPPGYPAGPGTLPYDQPGAAALPPQGPIGAPPGPSTAPRPYAPGSVPPGVPGGPGAPGPMGGPPGPVPGPGAPGPGPAPRPGTAGYNVGEYVEDLERGRAPQHEGRTYPGGGPR